MHNGIRIVSPIYINTKTLNEKQKYKYKQKQLKLKTFISTVWLLKCIRNTKKLQ